MKNLGGQPHRALHLQLLVLCSTDKVSAHCRITDLVTSLSAGRSRRKGTSGVCSNMQLRSSMLFYLGRRTFLQVLDIPRSQGDPDPVDLAPFLLKPGLASSWFNCSHLRNTEQCKFAAPSQMQLADQLVTLPHLSQIPESAPGCPGLCKLRDVTSELVVSRASASGRP